MYSLPIAAHANARLTRRDCGPPRGRHKVTLQKTGRRAWPRIGKRRTRTPDGLPAAALFAAAARARRRRAWSCRSRSSPWSCHNARGGDARRRAPALRRSGHRERCAPALALAPWAAWASSACGRAAARAAERSRDLRNTASTETDADVLRD